MSETEIFEDPRTGIETVYRKGTPPEAAAHPGLKHRTCEIDGVFIEYDVPVRMRDDVTIYVDLFRPADGSKVPALIAWGPYGKHPHLDYGLWPGAEVDTGGLSEFTTFEALDPLAWAQAGYAVINVDIRGTWCSEGDASFFSRQEAEDEYDLIEWAGTQDWSNGKVGLAGVSYLAISQWAAAALRPPHLAAICVWEAVSDLYREFWFHGGIPSSQFSRAFQDLTTPSLSRVEDIDAMTDHHPLFDDYWRGKNADLAAIDVPAFIVASWSDHGLHTRGTLEGYKRIGSKEKWLEVHGRKKWATFYEPESMAKQRAFFDHFLKDEETGFSSWPKVRIEVREAYYQGKVRNEQEWPITRTNYVPLYLDAGSMKLSSEPVTIEESAAYDSASGSVTFDFTFAERTELTGYAKLRLWLSAPDADDADLFVALEKLDRYGRPVNFPFFSVAEDGHVALGWLRASHREIDHERSTPEQPVLKHQREQMLTDGEPVALDIEIWPSSTPFEPGEALRVIIQGTDINKYESGFVLGHHKLRNAGRHMIHTGGRFDSHLLVPVIPPAA